METKNSQRMISEAIRKIALGRSIDRVDMSHCGTGGVGTARLIDVYKRQSWSRLSNRHYVTSLQNSAPQNLPVD